jgi:hypothetical protein
VFQYDEVAKKVYVIENEALWRVWLGNLRKYQSLWFPFQKSIAIWFLLSVHLVSWPRIFLDTFGTVMA